MACGVCNNPPDEINCCAPVVGSILITLPDKSLTISCPARQIKPVGVEIFVPSATDVCTAVLGSI